MTSAPIVEKEEVDAELKKQSNTSSSNAAASKLKEPSYSMNSKLTDQQLQASQTISVRPGPCSSILPEQVGSKLERNADSKDEESDKA